MADFFNTPGGIAVLILAQVLAVVAFVMISLLFLVYGDRKIWAAVQMRRGPNVVGVYGLLQSVADALKYVVKEVVIPAGADRTVFILAPMTSFVLAMIAWAVIPFNDGWVLSDINVAILYVFAVSSLGSLRRDHGRLGVELEIPVPGLAALCRTDDFLRGLHRSDHHRRDHLDRFDELW